MNSLIIGIARTGDADNHLLSPDISYIAMCGSYPEATFSINCKQLDFYGQVKLLRYTDADPNASAPAIAFFKNLVTKIYTDLKYLSIDEKDKAPLHIRLVTSPIELAQLPFEFGLDPNSEDKTPLLLNPERAITLTREVRQVKEAIYNWPVKPRILFAWSQPADTVPHDEHAAVLLNIVKPLAKPDPEIADPEATTGKYFTELPNASLQSLGNEIDNAIADKNPYTHIHLLVHGGHIMDFTGVEFRLIFSDAAVQSKVVKVKGADLIKAIVRDNCTPVVVTLSACDSGNEGNVMLPSGSLVQQLHNAGIPCVIASQFPLTQSGSVTMTKTLYAELIHASDPRSALYKTRLALKDSFHDWASMIAYTRFPENINEQLQRTRLKMMFDGMKTTAAWVDHVFKFIDKITPEKKESIFKDLRRRLDDSIEKLLDVANKDKIERKLSPSDAAENLGLLGSAYKRKAEFLYHLIDLQPENKESLLAQSLDTLQTAKNFYYAGFDANPASHWNAMQYLSLKAVLEGCIEDDIWTVVKFMALKDEKNAADIHDKVWSWGTLTELFMLRPLLCLDSSGKETAPGLTDAKNYISMMANSGPEFNQQKESTARQLERYIYWFPQLITSDNITMLKEAAGTLRGFLPPVAELM